MAAKSDRVVFIGTSDGVFRAQGNGGGYQAQPCGLKGKGLIRNMLADMRDTHRIYATTLKDGLWRSVDGGDNWHEINHGLIYKETWSLAQDPDTGTLYAGTCPSSVFKSADGGDTWIDCEGVRALPETKDWTFPQPPHVSHVKGLDVRNGRILGAVEVGWIIRSVDEGETWKNIKNGTEHDSHYVVSMPDNADVVIHASGKGIQKSVDGGQSFVKASRGMNHRYMAPVVTNPKRPNMLYACAAEVGPPQWAKRTEGANAGLYRSEDQGDSWQQLKGGLPEVMTAAPRAAAGDPEDANVFFMGTFPGRAWHAAPGQIPAGTLWITEDGGESFRQILDGIPAINSLLVVHF